MSAKLNVEHSSPWLLLNLELCGPGKMDTMPVCDHASFYFIQRVFTACFETGAKATISDWAMVPTSMCGSPRWLRD